MTRHVYYEDMKRRARELRAEFTLTTPQVRLSDLRRIYKAKGIRIDLWDQKLKNLRGAYFLDEAGPSVMLSKRLPDEQRIFTMGHELKHHIVDGVETRCMDLDKTDAIEIGAEVFAAELIYPETECLERFHSIGVLAGTCTAEHVVRLKRETNTTLSFTGLGKRAIWFGLAAEGAFDAVHWKKLEEKLYGEPLYKKLQRRRGLARL